MDRQLLAIQDFPTQSIFTAQNNQSAIGTTPVHLLNKHLRLCVHTRNPIATALPGSPLARVKGQMYLIADLCMAIAQRITRSHDCPDGADSITCR